VASNAPQRRYRAACPQCGAPVEFASAASLAAVCGYCSSALVREGAALQRIGQSAELFDDHSPLQLGTAGRWQGVPFTLVGRLQIDSDDGRWTEWHALFEDSAGAPPRSAWLSEDNGAYVFTFPAPADTAPALDTLRLGQRTLLAGRAWDVAALVTATLVAAQGELPFRPRLAGRWRVAELRNGAGEVASLEDSDGALHVSIGRGVALADLALSGLRDAEAVSDRALGTRHFECPSCGAGLDLRVAGSKTIACPTCSAVVDVADKAAGDVLPFYRQARDRLGTAEPVPPLGATARLKLGADAERPWTVVGRIERADIPEDGEDERSFWRETLLYNQQAGFAFLVDADDGWSWVRPMPGAPEVHGRLVKHGGHTYQEKWRYRAEVTQVLGELYWKLAEGDVAEVTDYQGLMQPRQRLSRERSGREITWSAGETLDVALLARAFGLPAERFGSADTTPLSASVQDLGQAWKGASSKVVWIFVAVVILLMVLDSCSDECDEVRTTFGEASAEYRECRRSASGSGSSTRGGSYGGWSSGGGHK
jgi:DNA-directed RNA polymerase subunit RPC12/RpoP